MLSFAYKRFDGKVPEPGDPLRNSKGLDDEDRALLEKVEAGFETVGELYNTCQFRAAFNAALTLAREANVYTFAMLSAGLDRKAPWFQIKEDKAAAATTVYVILGTERLAAGLGAAGTGAALQEAGRERG